MIKIQHLSFSYPKSTSLFDDLTLEMPVGGIYGLLGKNGTGKTSLLKIIAGLLFPKAGECEVLGYQPKRRARDFLAQLYVLPEEFYVPAVTMKTYCDLYAPFYPNFNHKLLAETLSEFELPQHQKLTQMSHGQKKKFLVAFGIATESRLLILDEPTNGLDIPSKAQFKRLLTSHFSENRLFIISTHQVHDVEKLIDHIVMLENGKIIFDQSMATITEKVCFQRQTAAPKETECLYSEQQLGGYMVVNSNIKHQITDIDLEVLFNAILVNRKQFDEIFSQSRGA